MPKIVEKPKTRTQIQRESDERLGIMTKAYKLHRDDVAMIKATAERLGLPQNQLIVKAVLAYAEQNS